MNPPFSPSRFIGPLLGISVPALILAAAPLQRSPRVFAVAELSNPRGLAVDATGNLFVGDPDTGALLKIAPTGAVSAAGGSGGSMIKDPIGVALGRNGALFVADADAGAVFKISASGAVMTFGTAKTDASFSTPTSVAVDLQGDVYVANNGNNVILKIVPAGSVSVFAGKAGASGSTDGAGAAARFASPRGLAIDAQGDLYVADEGNCNIRKITAAGVVSTLAGAAGESGSADGSGSAARFAAPRALVASAEGIVYVADTDNNTIRKITPVGVVTTYAGQAGEAGKVDGAAPVARFSEPRGIALDGAGNVYVADSGNGAIREITPGGLVCTVAAAARP